jgi:SpoIID/LytB domain protein
MSLRVFPSAAIRTRSAKTAQVAVVSVTVLSLIHIGPAGAAGPRTQATGSQPVQTVPVVAVPAGDALPNPVPVTPVDPNAAVASEAVTAPAPTTTTIPKNRILVLKGRGFGHGRGLGQWGAFGYAKDFGWNYRKILDHYYGGTVSGQVSPKSAIGVRLSASDEKALTVFQPKGRLFTAPEGQEGFTMPPGLAGSQPATVIDVNAVVPVVGAPIPVANQTGTLGPTTPVAGTLPGVTPITPVTPPLLTAGPAAIKIELVKGGFRVSDGPNCAGPWSVRPGLLNTSNVTLTAGPTEAEASPDDPENMLQICTGKQRRVYRGDLLAVDAKPGQRTVNIVGLDAYLRGVVPREIAASWSDKAHEAVKAQAVAARSYAAAEKRSGFSNTCDTISCQVYNGRGIYEGTKFISYEDVRTDRAVAETANEVRVNPKTGAPVRTEFSASTGGHTAPGDFPPVEDKGDATSANPNASWTVRLAATRFEANHKNLGALIGAKVTKRDGYGNGGGRVLEMQLNYTGGSRKVTGRDMMGAYGLRSSWFDAQVVAEGSETPIESLDPNSALTGDAGGAVSAAVTVAPSVPGTPRVKAPASGASSGAGKKVSKRAKASPATTIAVVVAIAGTPVNTVVGGVAAGAPTTAVKPVKVTKRTRKQKQK